MSRPTTAVLLVIVVCACSLFLCIHGKAVTHEQQQLRGLEERWLQFEDDPAALESILADDFIHVLPFGFVTKSEQIGYLRSHPSTRRGRRRFQDMRVRVFGNMGIVNGIVEATEPDGKVQKTIFTDIFAYREGHWQAVNAQELPFNHSVQR